LSRAIANGLFTRRLSKEGGGENGEEGLLFSGIRFAVARGAGIKPLPYPCQCLAEVA